MTGDIEGLIDAILTNPTGGGCWASRLEGDARVLVAKLQEAESQGRRPNRHAAARVLREHFGVRISDKQIGNHLRGSCSCE